jgi:hypothetical protein
MYGEFGSFSSTCYKSLIIKKGLLCIKTTNSKLELGKLRPKMNINQQLILSIYKFCGTGAHYFQYLHNSKILIYRIVCIGSTKKLVVIKIIGVFRS